MAAAVQTTQISSVNKCTLVTYTRNNGDANTGYSDTFQIPVRCKAVGLQIKTKTTNDQKVAIFGSNDGTNFSMIAGTETTQDSASAFKCAVFARNTGTGMIGYFPYYKIGLTTQSNIEATVATLSFIMD